MNSNNKESRRKFLGKALGVAAIAVLDPFTVLLKPRDVLAAGNGFIIDLNSQAYAQLNAVGGSYRIQIPKKEQTLPNGHIMPAYAFIVTRTTPSDFSVVLGWCTHEDSDLSPYDFSQKIIKCNNKGDGHTSTYSVDGIVLTLPSKTNLPQYSYTYHPLNNTLEVFLPGLGVKDGEISLAALELYQNYPNPVKAETTIPLKLLYYSKVTLTVTDALGHIIAILYDGGLEAGDHSFNFDASIFPSGTYFYHLSGGGQNLTKQMIVVR